LFRQHRLKQRKPEINRDFDAARLNEGHRLGQPAEIRERRKVGAASRRRQRALSAAARCSGSRLCTARFADAKAMVAWLLVD
jgi:hypothetical protein